MYKPPNSDTRIFNEHVGSVLKLLKTENKLCYILGDYNINILNHDSHNETRNFVELLFSYSLIPLINRPTRITKSTATLIDNVFTNNFVNIESSVQAIMVTDITDHFPIIHIDWKNEQAYSEATLVRRLYSHRNKQSFFTELAALDWNEMYMQNDTQAAFSRFHSTFLKLYDKHFPKRKITEKYNNRKPWLSEGLKQSIRNKNKLYIHMLKMRTASNEIKYKRYRNKLTHVLKCAERKYYADILEKNRSNLKQTWVILKSIINKK